jgi:Ribbon-helix-helix protein, copG family
MPKVKRRRSIAFDPAQLDEADKEAERQDITLSELIRRALAEFLTRSARKSARVTSPKDQKS